MRPGFSLGRLDGSIFDSILIWTFPRKWAGGPMRKWDSDNNFSVCRIPLSIYCFGMLQLLWTHWVQEMVIRLPSYVRAGAP